MDWTSIAAIFTAVGLVLGVIAQGVGLLEQTGALIAKLWRAIIGQGGAAAYPPTRTLILLPRPEVNAVWWHMGHSGGEEKRPMMQICADLNVSNIWDANIVMASGAVRYRKWGLIRHVQLAHAHVFSGDDNIPARSMVWVRVDAMFEPPWKAQGESLTADVGIVDQFGNYHWLNKVRIPNM